MNLEHLLSFFSTNPSARLLRAQHAPYIVNFLHEHFKAGGNLSSLHSVLQQRLADYLDTLRASDPDTPRDRADVYLNAWSTGETRWLRRYFDAQHSESVYQLTPHAEVVLTFLTQVLDRSFAFIGTESRLTRIIATLSDIVVRGSADPDRRLEFLRAERERIDHEIRAIQSGNAVETHSPTAIRERFSDAVSDLVSLQGDFRAVEESFKSITRDVQKRQAECQDSRGNILGFALDAEDHLKEQDQGASFQAFVRLILSQSQQDELERMTRQLDEIGELAEQMEGKKRVKGMIAHLSAEAEKVLQVTRRLNATLRRLLDRRASTTRLRLAEVLGEIRGLASRLCENPPDLGIDVLSNLDMLNVHQRTFWDAPVTFEELDLSNMEQSEEDRLGAFRHLAEMQRLDWDAMRSNIAGALLAEERVTLCELLNEHPPSSGAVEILGYIQLAHDDGHLVDDSDVEFVYLDHSEDDEVNERFEVPHVEFLSERLRLLRSHFAAGGAGDE